MKKPTRLVVAGLLLAACHFGSAQAGDETDVKPLAPDARDWVILQDLQGYAADQEKIYREFCEAKTPVVRDRSAFILSELWRLGLLKEELKNKLVEEHYHLILMQVLLKDGGPHIFVTSYQSFPFPEVWTEFTPALYVNDKVVWAPEKPVREHAMSQNNSGITSRTGGDVRNGDVLQYKIVLMQRDPKTEGEPKPVWKKTLRTNKIVVQGLKEPAPQPARVAPGREPLLL